MISISPEAQQLLDSHYSNCVIIYRNENIRYDGFSEFGPEIEICNFYIIFLHPSNTNNINKYTYMTYYKEYLIGIETEPEYQVIECNYHDHIDENLFYLWTIKNDIDCDRP